MNEQENKIELPYTQIEKFAKYTIDLEENGTYKLSVENNINKKIVSNIFVKLKEAILMIPIAEQKLEKYNNEIFNSNLKS